MLKFLEISQAAIRIQVVTNELSTLNGKTSLQVVFAMVTPILQGNCLFILSAIK